MSKPIARNITISINGKEVENSLQGVGKEIGKLKAELRKENFGSDRFKELKKQLDDTKGKYKEMNDEIRGTTVTADQAQTALSNVFTGIKTQDFNLVANGFTTITRNVTASAKALLALAFTPVGALLALVGAVVAATKAFINYNESIRPQIELTEQITRLQGEQADQARILADTIADTYGEDFKNTLETARSLVNAFGEDYTTVLNEIDEGLLRGGKSNDEYLDSLREYATFFAEAGFSVKEFSEIINAGFDLGIYTDKLPDAIKEFGLSVTEQTNSTRDAFTNAFGKEFTDGLFNNINDGSITVKEALRQTADEADKLGLTVQENAQLTADAFRGAGEDAGGALKIFEAVNKAYENQTRALTPLEQNLKDVRDANLALAQAQDEALKGDNYIQFANGIKIYWTNVKTQFFNAISFITDAFINLALSGTKAFGSIFSVIVSFPKIAGKAFTDVRKEIFDVVKSVTGLGEVFDRLVRLDFTGASAAAKAFKQNFTAELGGVSKVASNVINDVLAAAERGSESVQKLYDRTREGAVAAEKKRLEDLAALEKDQSKGNRSGGKKEDDLTAEDKAKLKSRERLAEMLDEFDRDQALKKEIENLDKLDAEEAKELDDLERKYEKWEEEAEGDAELLARLEEQKQTAILEVKEKYDSLLLEQNKIKNQNLARQENELNDRLIAAEDNLNAARMQAKQVGIGIIRSFFGERSSLGIAFLAIEKGLAIADILKEAAKAKAMVTANTAAANAAALAASPLTAGLPFTAINTAIAAKETAAITLSTAANIGAIVAQGIQQATGFYDGGPTGSRAIGYDSQGAVAGVVHTNEWVAPEYMTRSPRYANVIGWLEKERMQNLRGYKNGGSTSPAPSVVSSASVANASDGEMRHLMSRMINLLENPVKPNLLIGYPDVEKLTEVQDDIKNSANNGTLAQS